MCLADQDSVIAGVKKKMKKNKNLEKYKEVKANWEIDLAQEHMPVFLMILFSVCSVF